MLLKPSHRPPLLNASERARAARLRARGASARSRLRSKGRRRVQAESGPRKEDERRCVFITASDAMVRCRTRGGGGARYVSGSLKKLFKSSSEKSFELST